MLFEILEDKKMVFYWLSREERDNQPYRDSLVPEQKEWYSKGYKVVVFLSGDGDLYENTLGLLLHNRDLYAKKMMLKEQQAQQEAEKTQPEKHTGSEKKRTPRKKSSERGR